MKGAGSWKRGDQQGFEDAKKHPILIGLLHVTCIVIALNLTVTWYWRIVAFFAMQFAMGFVRMVLWPKLRGVIIDSRRRKEAEAVAWRIIRRAEAKYADEMSVIAARLREAAAESERRRAFLEDLAANGTPEERQWATAALNGPLVVTAEEAERRRDAPSPTARIERYRVECAAYDAAHASTVRETNCR
jgi:hypothetical protein